MSQITNSGVSLLEVTYVTCVLFHCRCWSRWPDAAVHRRTLPWRCMQLLPPLRAAQHGRMLLIRRITKPRGIRSPSVIRVMDSSECDPGQPGRAREGPRTTISTSCRGRRSHTVTTAGARSRALASLRQSHVTQLHARIWQFKTELIRLMQTTRPSCEFFCYTPRRTIKLYRKKLTYTIAVLIKLCLLNSLRDKNYNNQIS